MKKTYLCFLLFSALLFLTSCIWGGDAWFGITVLVQNSSAQPIASARVVAEGMDVLTNDLGCFSTGVGLTGPIFNRGRSLQVSAPGYKSVALDYKTDGIDSFIVTLFEETANGNSSIKKITPNSADSSSVAKCRQ